MYLAIGFFWTEMARHKWNISLSKIFKWTGLLWLAHPHHRLLQSAIACPLSLLHSPSICMPYPLERARRSDGYATRKTHCLHDNRSLGRTAISLGKTSRICLKTCGAQEHTCVTLWYVRPVDSGMLVYIVLKSLIRSHVSLDYRADPITECFDSFFCLWKLLYSLLFSFDVGVLGCGGIWVDSYCLLVDIYDYK